MTLFHCERGSDRECLIEEIYGKSSEITVVFEKYGKQAFVTVKARN